eukprot:753810-Amphidinium_carterae.1
MLAARKWRGLVREFCQCCLQVVCAIVRAVPVFHVPEATTGCDTSILSRGPESPIRCSSCSSHSSSFSPCSIFSQVGSHTESARLLSSEDFQELLQ